MYSKNVQVEINYILLQEVFYKSDPGYLLTYSIWLFSSQPALGLGSAGNSELNIFVIHI